MYCFATYFSTSYIFDIFQTKYLKTLAFLKTVV